MAPLYGRGSTASRLEPLRGSLLFTTKFQEIPGTHFIDLRRMTPGLEIQLLNHWAIFINIANYLNMHLLLFVHFYKCLYVNKYR